MSAAGFSGAAQTTGGAVRPNLAQQAAIERWGQDVCVVAGPGSGKTRVLIERFRWLVAAQGVPASRILAVTFTEKAATEIKRRLLASFAETAGLQEQIERAWVSTIHGFCTRLLRENAIAAGVDPNFELLDEPQARLLAGACADRVLDQLLDEFPDQTRGILSELDVAGQDWATALLHLYDESRSAGVPVGSLQLQQPASGPDTWREIAIMARAALSDPPNGTVNQRQAHARMHQWCHSLLAVETEPVPWQQRIALLDMAIPPGKLKAGSRARWAADQLRDKLIPHCRAAMILAAREPLYPVCLQALLLLDISYRKAKQLRAVLDFEDLQEAAIGLLESDATLRDRIRESFDQVLLDELQDTNRLQWRLMDLVRHPSRLFAVGDVNQSIYYFRHADPDVFRHYRDRLAETGKDIDQLRENYRSRHEIVAAVNAVVPYLLDGVERHELLARREYPSKAEPSIECVHTFPATPGDDPALTEARWIARRVREIEGRLLIGKPGEQRLARLSDIAILSRTILSLAPIQQALDERGIPSVVSGGRSFFETREVRDLLSWLGVLADPLDDQNLLVVLRSPLVGVSDDTLLQLSAVEEGLWAAIRQNPGDDSEDWLRLKSFAGLIETQRAAAGRTPPDEMLADAIDHSSYACDLPDRAQANIAKLLAMLREIARSGPVGLGRVVESLARLRRIGSEPEAAAAERTDAVRLLSVHAAKGLEFPIVFVAAMRNGGQNRDPILCFDEAGHLGARWRHPATGQGIPDPVHLNVSRRKQLQQEGEEDRLLYVAMTRAEEHLVFSASPGGNGAWWKRVTEAFNIATGVPKEEFQGTVHLLDGTAIGVRFISQVPAGTAATRLQTQTEPPVRMMPPDEYNYQESVVPVTSVAQHAFCPRQYFLARYLGWPAAGNRQSNEPPAPEPQADPVEWSASELGVMVHELLAGKREAADVPLEAVDLTKSFTDSILGARARRATTIAHEFDFLLSLEGMIVRGQMDLWFEEDGELVLIDYKTDQVTAGQEHRQAFRYGPQMRLYAMALERWRKRPVTRAFIFFLRTGVAVPVSLKPERIEEATLQVRQLREAQAKLEFPPREGNHCTHCGYYLGACPARPELTLTESAPLPTSLV
jgi:ATP-dependent exoDNAse (exonuclease V) beta subunit